MSTFGDQEAVSALSAQDVPVPAAEPSISDLLKLVAQQNQLITKLLTDRPQPKQEDSSTALLAQIMMAREKRLLAEDEAKQEARRIREIKRLEENTATAREIEEGYAMCPHLKGGRHGERRGNMPKDYNLGFHRFPDASSQIRCLSCGCVWRPGDTREFRYVPNGSKFARIVNLTGKSFEDMYALFAGESTNKPTSSEISGSVIANNVRRQLKAQMEQEARQTPEQSVMLDAPPVRA